MPDALEQMFNIQAPRYALGPSPQGLVGPGAESIAPLVEGPLPSDGAATGQPATPNGALAGSSSPGSAAPTGGSGFRPPEPLLPIGDLDPAQLDADFWQRHGRAPTALEVEAYTAVPMLQRNLGRPPLKIEVLQHLASRLENPTPTPSRQVIAEQEPTDGLSADLIG